MRESGILMPVSSLPGPYGIGCFGKAAFQFVDFLSAAGQTIWQLLPLSPTGYGDSPYQSCSAFAGNPYFIDLDALKADGLLTAAQLKAEKWGDDPLSVDYGTLYTSRYKVLRTAYAAWREKYAGLHGCAHSYPDDYYAFTLANEDWLEDYALYMACKRHFGMKAWTEWPDDDLRLRKNEAVLDKYRTLLREDVQFFTYLQFLFFRQWTALRDYVHQQGIRIIGDLPIYVAMDSADVWAEPQFFQLDDDLVPKAVAGVPPDYFTADGQLWGNPLYDWDYHRRTGYAWWILRIRHALSIYDILRIDHFRGIESYYAIPAGNKTAAGGHWEKGPDRDFINAMHENLGEGGIIAEDLGYLTPEVKAMLSASGYPGMKIMQFAFDSRESGNYLPHTYPRNSVVYTGTHDNVTTEGWRSNASAEDVAYACRYLRCTPEELTEGMICACLASVSDTAIIPLADWLHLGSEARINTPSTQGANWRWRLAQSLPAALAGHIAALTTLYERVPKAL